ncbi:MAG: glycosyltransferase [Massilibacteroides sp.]|nr:glycosyltransferase [Massilibacteroides sp.]
MDEEMKVFLYSGMQNMIEKSGVGRAIYHQKSAAKINGIGVASNIVDADIVHINTVFPKSLYVAHLAHRHGIPVVYHAHSTKEDFKNSYLGSNLFDGLFGKWIKLCYNCGDVIVTPSMYSKDLLESYGINKKIEVISNGIDLEYYNKENVKPGEFRKKYGFRETDKVIMSVGLTIERKGILDFVELARRMPEYQFIWFGETNLYTVPVKIRKAVHSKLPNLKFAGYAQKKELRNAYRECDLFLFPSKEETEGIVVLEALAMKIPVLLRNIPVYEDWLYDKEQVYKADNIDSFEQISKQILEGECDNLTEKGYEVVKERAIEKVGKQLYVAYKEALKVYENNNCLENV